MPTFQHVLIYVRGCEKLIRRYCLAQKNQDNNEEDRSTDLFVLHKVATERLANLLCPDNLDMEISSLANAIRSTSKSSSLPSNIFASIMRQRAHGAAVDEVHCDDLDNGGMVTIFSHVLSTIEILEDFSKGYAEVLLIQRSMGWEIARSLSIISRWYTDTGPMLANQLFQAHRYSGDRWLRVEYPLFAHLVDHIMTYIKAIHASKTAKKPKKKKRHSSPLNLEPSISDLRCLPPNVFGPNIPSAVGYLILEINIHTVPGSEDSQYLLGEKCFIRIISDIWLDLRLKNVDERVNGPCRRGSSNPDSHKSKLKEYSPWVQRTIIRGAVIDTLINVCKGDDAILASVGIQNILETPVKLFTSSTGNPTKEYSICRRILSRPTEALAPIRSWLTEHLAVHPNLLVKIGNLGDLVYGIMRDRGVQNFSRINAHQIIATAKPQKSTILKPSKNSRATINYSDPLTLGGLLKNPDDDIFSQIAVLLREAFNKRRSLPIGDTHISRVMDGMSATTGKARQSHDIDHYDPIRLDNTYAQMLKEHFTLERLLSCWGLTNLLIWMSTGQGYMTREFCRYVELWFEALEKRLEVFRAAADNEMKISYFNSRIWGTACASFNVECAKFTIEEKFTPFFRDEVLEAWREFLGACYDNIDAKIQPDKLPTWTDALYMLEKLYKVVKLNGFKNGLTTIQFANNLCALGICQPPTVDALGHWIYLNQNKGAFQGLKQLGFQVEGRPEHWTKAALQCVVDHLDATLTDSDKSLLVSGVLTDEHILCKISRFDKILCRTRSKQRKFDSGVTQSSMTLKTIGLEAIKNHPWKSGENLLDTSGQKLPIPGYGEKDRLEASVKLWA